MTSLSTATDAAFPDRCKRLADQAEPLLNHALGTGGTYADLFYEHTTHHRYTLRHKSQALPAAVEAQQQALHGVGLRVLRDTEAGYAASEHLSPRTLRATAQAAAAQIGTGHPQTSATPLSSPSRQETLPADAPDGISDSEKRILLEHAADAALALDDRVKQVEVDYHDRVRRTLVATSEGRLVVQATALLGLRVAVTLTTDSHTATAYAMSGGPFGFGHFFAHSPEETARQAVIRARAMVEAHPFSAGPTRIVISGGWGGVWLHEAVGHLLEADAATAHGLLKRSGTRIASTAVTLIDDATLPKGRGSAPWDDEGEPAQRTPLIDQGILQNLLTDRVTATRHHLPHTGNARRQDFHQAPLPRMTNLLLLPGTTAPDDLVADVQEGLYVKTIGQGQVLPEEDRFVFDVVEGYRIEHGRLTQPVTGVQVYGQASSALEAIVAIGNDFKLDTARGLCKKADQIVPVSVGMPSVLLHGLSVR